MVFSPLFLSHKHAKNYCPGIALHIKKLTERVGERVIDEYEHGFDFLLESYNSLNNYRSIRAELCLFLNWLWFKNIPLGDVTHKNIMDFVDFCNDPPAELITQTSGVPISVNEPKNMAIDEWSVELNDEWRPFYNSRGKLGLGYQRLPATMNRQLSVISSFFTYLNDIGFMEANPAAIAIRRLKPTNVANLGITDERHKALSQVQVDFIFSTLETLCIKDPLKFERTRFLFYFMVLAYPRRSEIAARPSHSPSFSDFSRGHTDDGKVFYSFYIPRSKGGKSRSVIISDMLLEAIKRYRVHLGLTPLPLSTERDIPLFVRHQVATHGRQEGILNSNLGDAQIAALITELFNLTADVLSSDEYCELEEAEDLRGHSIHDLRHLGITNDLFSGRSAQEVMKCSGHSSFSAFEKYISARLELRVPNVNLKDKILTR